MEPWKAGIVVVGLAAFSAACGGQTSQSTSGTAGGGTGGGGGGTAGSDGGGAGGTGGQGASGGAGGTTTSSGGGGAGGSGGLPPCGQDGTGVCISSAQTGCPIGFLLTQMGCDAGGGDPGSCCLPAGESFPCGELSCDTATQYCLESSGGPCCEPPSYECLPLPAACQAPGADCACFEQADCPCGGGPWPCNQSIGTFCDTNEGGLTFLCGYP